MVQKSSNLSWAGFILRNVATSFPNSLFEIGFHELILTSTPGNHRYFEDETFIC